MLTFVTLDDILILCDYKDYKSIQDEITFDLDTIGLKVHEESEKPSKVSHGDLSKDFTYLGYKFSDCTVTVREKSISNLQESIIKIFTNYKYSKPGNLKLLQWVLNLRITGSFLNKINMDGYFFSLR